ncbi:MAG TPA: trehalose-phosphatase [Acidimicrobiales bacterium]|nr:trehalose-phosphatase [Acidimicrobiales bacterium]
MTPEEALAVLADRPEATCVVTDFDGTLSPIVARPEDAAPLPGAPEALGRLAGRFGRVAVVSGRPATFLSERLGLAGGVPDHLFVVGLYGLESLGPHGEVVVAPDAEQWRDAVALAADEAEADGPAEMGVERKGLTVTLHWRRAPGAEGWAKDFAERAAGRLGLAAHLARASVELRPPVAVDKGTAVESLVAGFEVACFAGDDLGDLPAFAALDRFAAGGGRAVKVGVRSSEAPSELLAAADVTVDGPQEVLALLGQLAERAGG